MKAMPWVAGLALVAMAALALDPPKTAPATPAQAPAQTEAPPPAGEPPARETPARETPPPAEPPPPQPPEDDEQLPPLPPDLRRTGPTPQRFEPTEKVRADFPVSFPIDI